MTRRINQGQSLFEVVFAIGIMALITVSIVSVSVIAIRNNQASKNKALANKYTNEAMEWLRTERDINFDPFQAKAGHPPSYPDGKTWCADVLDMTGWIGGQHYCQSDQYIPNTYFIREVNLYTDSPESSVVKVTVYVKWTDSQGSHENRSVTEFTNWQ